MSYLPASREGLGAATPVRPHPDLAIVVPCHNEEEGLPALLSRLERLSDDLLARRLPVRPLRLVLVDDGSRDGTWEAIRTAATPLHVTAVRLSRNHGHQNALIAGLAHAEGDAVVSMDADLQDDPDAVIGMVEAYARGAEIVYGVRASRASDTFAKRSSARAYYGALRRLGVDIIPDHADFRLMSRRALQALDAFGETNLFLRGMVRKLGFASEIVHYDRAPRTAGESSYPVGKMVALALEGVTSLSVKPLRMIVGAGFAVAGIALLFGLYAAAAWAFGRTVPGWTSIVLPLSLLGGMHLVALGVIGEYVGKIYEETKRRPRFIVDECVPAGGTGRLA